MKTRSSVLCEVRCVGSMTCWARKHELMVFKNDFADGRQRVWCLLAPPIEEVQSMSGKLKSPTTNMLEYFPLSTSCFARAMPWLISLSVAVSLKGGL